MPLVTVSSRMLISTLYRIVCVARALSPSASCSRSRSPSCSHPFSRCPSPICSRLRFVWSEIYLDRVDGRCSRFGNMARTRGVELRASKKRKRRGLSEEQKLQISETVSLGRSTEVKSEALISDADRGKQNICRHYYSKQETEETVKEELLALTMTKGNGKPWSFPRNLQSYGRGALRIGTSGYVYKHWKKIVYPERLPQKQWFEHYTHLFDTVEINNTFYRLPSLTVFENWHKQAPPGFCYALKFSRFGTHLKHLKDPDGPISLFLDRVLPLGHCQGPILVQLPPKFDLNLERLKLFLDKAPRCYRWSVEVRDSRWLCAELYSLLNAHNASLVIHDHKDIPFRHPKIVTADWIYLRFHGHDYTQCYSQAHLQDHASWIKEQLGKGIDVYAYFNNDACGYAALNALDLREMVLGSFEVEPEKDELT